MTDRVVMPHRNGPCSSVDSGAELYVSRVCNTSFERVVSLSHVTCFVLQVL